jgi:3-deoxy-7-phosphoheptulonate synthase
MVDVHPTPDTALVDGAQALLPSEFAEMMTAVNAIASVLGRVL